MADVDIKFHKRVDGDCTCKSPGVCSVVSNRFWCYKCGKDLEPLTHEQLESIKGLTQDEIILQACNFNF